ncbi:plastocyanin/azurin family copper-binding protein [Candidatus Nitrososphaera gargensis]|nr:plastocyanin/azurin family copper-binding protein [Candidatus Nitrososphaera gargensis]
MSHDEREHEKEPMILTSGRRMAKGLAIVVITLAIGAAIIVPFFDEMFSIPPPVTQLRQPTPPPSEGEEPQPGGATTIQIPSGASVQGNPSYEPANAEVPMGSEVVWDNTDSVPHTATSGTGQNDPTSGDLFDTSIINPNEKSDSVVLEGVSEGDVIDYYCTLHPYMTAQLTIVAAGEGSSGGAQTGGEGGAAGSTINILSGSSVQGNPDFDPDGLTAKVGDKINVVNQDNVPHTVTSGTGQNDPNKGQAFDTNIIMGGQSATISLAEVEPGQYDYFCTIHPYMTGKLTVE